MVSLLERLEQEGIEITDTRLGQSVIKKRGPDDGSLEGFRAFVLPEGRGFSRQQRRVIQRSLDKPFGIPSDADARIRIVSAEQAGQRLPTQQEVLARQKLEPATISALREEGTISRKQAQQLQNIQQRREVGRRARQFRRQQRDLLEGDLEQGVRAGQLSASEAARISVESRFGVEGEEDFDSRVSPGKRQAVFQTEEERFEKITPERTGDDFTRNGEFLTFEERLARGESFSEVFGVPAPVSREAFRRSQFQREIVPTAFITGRTEEEVRRLGEPKSVFEIVAETPERAGRTFREVSEGVSETITVPFVGEAVGFGAGAGVSALDATFGTVSLSAGSLGESGVFIVGDLVGEKNPSFTTPFNPKRGPIINFLEEQGVFEREARKPGKLGGSLIFTPKTVGAAAGLIPDIFLASGKLGKVSELFPTKVTSQGRQAVQVLGKTKKGVVRGTVQTIDDLVAERFLTGKTRFKTGLAGEFKVSPEKQVSKQAASQRRPVRSGLFSQRQLEQFKQLGEKAQGVELERSLAKNFFQRPVLDESSKFQTSFTGRVASKKLPVRKEVATKTKPFKPIRGRVGEEFSPVVQRAGVPETTSFIPRGKEGAKIKSASEIEEQIQKEAFALLKNEPSPLRVKGAGRAFTIGGPKRGVVAGREFSIGGIKLKEPVSPVKRPSRGVEFEPEPRFSFFGQERIGALKQIPGRIGGVNFVETPRGLARLESVPDRRRFAFFGKQKTGRTQKFFSEPRSSVRLGELEVKDVSLTGKENLASTQFFTGFEDVGKGFTVAKTRTVSDFVTPRVKGELRGDLFQIIRRRPYRAIETRQTFARQGIKRLFATDKGKLTSKRKKLISDIEQELLEQPRIRGLIEAPVGLGRRTTNFTDNDLERLLKNLKKPDSLERRRKIQSELLKFDDFFLKKGGRESAKTRQVTLTRQKPLTKKEREIIAGISKSVSEKAREASKRRARRELTEIAERKARTTGLVAEAPTLDQVFGRKRKKTFVEYEEEFFYQKAGEQVTGEQVTGEQVTGEQVTFRPRTTFDTQFSATEKFRAKTTPKFFLGTKSRLDFKTRTSPRTITTTRNFPITFTPAPPKIFLRPPSFRNPPLDSDEKKFFTVGRKMVQGYNVRVKKDATRNARFKKINEKPLPLKNALEQGLEAADETISQTVKIKKSNKKVPRKVPPLRLRINKFRLKGQKQKPNQNIFGSQKEDVLKKIKKQGKATLIEKRDFAIDSAGEKNKLKLERFLKQKSKRGLGAVF